jgi:hypothetical protein
MASIMSTAKRLLQAGQKRADKLLTEIDRVSGNVERGGSFSYEAGALRGLVRNLCAELDAFEPEDGSIEVWFKGSPLWVHLGQELIQANGFDIAHLLDADTRAAIVTLAEEKQRDQWLECAEEARAELRAAA